AAKLKCEESSRCNLTQPMLPPDAEDRAEAGALLPLLDRLKISYQCEPVIRSRLICADTYTTLSCGRRGRILTLDAVLTSRYLLPQLLDSADFEPDDVLGSPDGIQGLQGRTQRCPDTARPESNAARCPDSQASVFGEVKRRCDGRHSCTVLADAQLLMADMPGCARPHLLLLFACLRRSEASA
uniref:SUEL-type lectin domain-containing protein n=1 Tax=Macrostomum lignano TaxID=282301 RepID=A0A1I8JEB4_9PLAT